MDAILVSEQLFLPATTAPTPLPPVRPTSFSTELPSAAPTAPPTNIRIPQATPAYSVVPAA